MDSDSDDNTTEVFKNTETKTEKVSYNTGKNGKGTNLLKLFEISVSHNAKYICTIDSDLTSIEPFWIKSFIDPLINGETDYVVPVYGRNKFEANTTNHFCYPILSVYFNTPVRQPYAGDFSLNIEVVNYLLKQQIIPPIYNYGIDIFMTIHAVAGGFTVREVYLGQKIHKPSFPKMVPMFRQASATVFMLLNNYKGVNIENKLIPEIESHRSGILNNFVRKPSEESITERENLALSLIDELSKSEYNPFHKNYEYIIEKIKLNDFKMSATEWSRILGESIRIVQTLNSLTDDQYVKLGELFTPFYLLRVVEYFKEIKDINNNQVESIINVEVGILSRFKN